MSHTDKEIGFDILFKRKINKNKDKNDDSFEKGEYEKLNEEPFDDEAIILQSILKYSETFGCNNYFKSRELSENHLLKNCEHYIDYYKDFKAKTRLGARKENINDKVVELLEKLSYLELIDIKSCTAKNKELTQIYRFTNLGRLIGLLLLSEKRTPTIQTFRAI